MLSYTKNYENIANNLVLCFVNNYKNNILMNTFAKINDINTI